MSLAGPRRGWEAGRQVRAYSCRNCGTTERDYWPPLRPPRGPQPRDVRGLGERPEAGWWQCRCDCGRLLVTAGEYVARAGACPTCAATAGGRL